jgi:ferredoxin
VPKKYKFLKNIPLNLYAGKKPLQSCFQNPLKGMLDVFQSAGICNRCGVCNQACPSYRALQAEVYSPRGRNQLFRLITDRKLSSDIPKKDVLVPVETCLLCGNCTAACAAYAPANKHVKLIKDALGKNIAGLFKILRLKFFTACPALLFTIKNIKYKLPFDSKITAVYLPSEEGLKHSKTTVKEIKKTNETLYTIKSGLLLTEAAMTADFKILKKTLGNILKEYITLLSPEPLVIITDNIEEYRILKQAREISQDFAPLAANVKFITDYIKPQKMKTELFKGKK